MGLRTRGVSQGTKCVGFREQGAGFSVMRYPRGVMSGAADTNGVRGEERWNLGAGFMVCRVGLSVE